MPLSCSLVAVLSAAQLSKLTASIGLGDGLKRSFEGLSGLLDQGLSQAREDLLNTISKTVCSGCTALLLFLLLHGVPHKKTW